MGVFFMAKSNKFDVVKPDNSYYGFNEYLNDFIDEIIKCEGIYSSHPNDLGGETVFGFSRKYHNDLKIFVDIDNFCNENGIDNNQRHSKRKIINRFLESRYGLYHPLLVSKYSEYFPFKDDSIKSQIILKGVGNDVNRFLSCLKMSFFFSVNAGFNRARNLFSLALSESRTNLDEILYRAIKEYYENIALKREENKVFLKGWINRLNRSATL